MSFQHCRLRRISVSVSPLCLRTITMYAPISWIFCLDVLLLCISTSRYVRNGQYLKPSRATLEKCAYSFWFLVRLQPFSKIFFKFSWILQIFNLHIERMAVVRECNFSTGKILGKHFPEALVHTVHRTRAYGTRPMDSMDLCFRKTLSQNFPHAEIRHLRTFMFIVNIFAARKPAIFCS